jgi:putative DNA primase/helicase
MARDNNDMKEAIIQAGLTPPEQIIFDEKLHRFPTNGNRNDKAGYYCAFDHGDFQAGFWGDWRTQIYQTWTSKRESELTPEQRRAYREKIQIERARADFARADQAKKSAVTAKKIWEQAPAAPDEYPYLLKKGVKSYGLRNIKPNGLRPDVIGGRLIVPVTNTTGEIMSLQFIDADGNKKFLPGGTVKGGFYKIPGTTENIYLAEGFATAATIHEATGATIFMAFNAGNLKPVAEAIRTKYPDTMIICADNDAQTPGNPGLTKAREAAAAVGAAIVWPEFTDAEQANKPSDFNDLAAVRDLDAVKERLTQAAIIEPASADIPLQEVIRAAFDKQQGCAGLFTILYRSKFLYDHAAGRWHTWADNYWMQEPICEPLRDCDSLIELFVKGRITLEVKLSETKKKHSEDSNEVKTIERQIKAMTEQIGMLKNLHYRKQVVEFSAVGTGSLGISGDEWDCKPWLLPCKNGVIDLKTGAMRPGRQSDFLKTFCPTANDPAAKSPSWEKALSDIFDGDQGLINFVQRAFGMALVGAVVEHVLFILFGAGRNGKDTILTAIHDVMGDLAGPVQAELLLDQHRARSSSGPSADIMALRGRRLAWASETNEGKRLDAGRVKQLTGGGNLVGRAPFGKREINFPASHTLFLMTNSKPHVNAEDYALWKRIHLIPFEISFIDDPKEAHERKRDKSLPGRLKAEAPGILNWLIQGCLAWQERGLDPPDKVKGATAEYQAAEDIIAQFKEACCETGPDFWEATSDLYQKYKNWTESNGIKAMSGTAFGTRIGKLFEKETRRVGGRQKKGYRGIKIEGDFNDDDKKG